MQAFAGGGVGGVNLSWWVWIQTCLFRCFWYAWPDITIMHLEMVWNSEESSGLKIDLWNNRLISNMWNRENRSKHPKGKKASVRGTQLRCEWWRERGQCLRGDWQREDEEGMDGSSGWRVLIIFLGRRGIGGNSGRGETEEWREWGLLKAWGFRMVATVSGRPQRALEGGPRFCSWKAGGEWDYKFRSRK